MTADQLRALQAPLKTLYKEHPERAAYTLAIEGMVDDAEPRCNVASPRGTIVAGLHPATGGDGTLACSADMLLEALVGCAGVTLKAVATAMNIPLRRASIRAEGDLDFRGTLGVSRETPVGIRAVRLTFTVDADATAEQVDKLIQLTERYCVVYQTLSRAPQMTCQRASV